MCVKMKMKNANENQNGHQYQSMTSNLFQSALKTRQPLLEVSDQIFLI